MCCCFPRPVSKYELQFRLQEVPPPSDQPTLKEWVINRSAEYYDYGNQVDQILVSPYLFAKIQKAFETDESFIYLAAGSCELVIEPTLSNSSLITVWVVNKEHNLFRCDVIPMKLYGS